MTSTYQFIETSGNLHQHSAGVVPLIVNSAELPDDKVEIIAYDVSPRNVLSSWATGVV